MIEMFQQNVTYQGKGLQILWQVTYFKLTVLVLVTGRDGESWTSMFAIMPILTLTFLLIRFSHTRGEYVQKQARPQ